MLLDVFQRGRRSLVQVEVDGTVYNVVGIGDTLRRRLVRAAVGLGRLRHVPVRRRALHALRQLHQVGVGRRQARRVRPRGERSPVARGRPMRAAPAPSCDARVARSRRAAAVRPGRVPYDGRMLRMLTAGESHGKALVAVLEGLPAGVPVSTEMLAAELARRRHGHGRGGRQRFESRPLRDPHRRAARAHARLADRGHDPQPRVRVEVRAT